VSSLSTQAPSGVQDSKSAGVSSGPWTGVGHGLIGVAVHSAFLWCRAASPPFSQIGPGGAWTWPLVAKKRCHAPSPLAQAQAGSVSVVLTRSIDDFDKPPRRQASMPQRRVLHHLSPANPQFKHQALCEESWVLGCHHLVPSGRAYEHDLVASLVLSPLSLILVPHPCRMLGRAARWVDVLCILADRRAAVGHSDAHSHAARLALTLSSISCFI
jgi:hypothetical protein